MAKSVRERNFPISFLLHGLHVRLEDGEATVTEPGHRTHVLTVAMLLGPSFAPFCTQICTGHTIRFHIASSRVEAAGHSYVMTC